MKICILLPAYNEEKSLGALLKSVRPYGLDAVVIDDGSADATSEIARQGGAILLRHAGNQGKGQALRTGFHYAVERGYDAVLIMDADGQHDPQEIPAFCACAEKTRAGIVIGNRMHCPTGMPLVRKLTNWLTSFFISRLTDRPIPDTQCGYRLLRTDLLKKMHLSTNNYDTESEILIEAARHHEHIESIPIRSIYRDHKSQIHPVRDTVRFWMLMIRKLLRREPSRPR
ncbi:MAG: glycosyltransferase family 2 protein [Candidatus Omnitrophica bacterium]|nr:glycosyltransferase family 2 protein [Candidatus Omnitrophota bacterium]